MKTPSTLAPLFALGLIWGSASLAGCSSEADPAGDGDGDMTATGDGDMTATGDGDMTATGDGDMTTTGDGDTSATLDYPEDSSQAGIEAFIAAESYKSAPWIGDAAVRESDDAWAHGNALRVYFNTLAQDSKNNETPTQPGAMAVKEFYDEAGTHVGTAVSLKVGEGTTMNDVVFYCTAPDGSNFCTGSQSNEHPFYGAGISDCGFCHGGELLLSPLPQ